jgi:acyl-CoA synthetase (AMP-forming)/AMP-acid ligase II
MNPAIWLQRTASLHPERPALFRGTTLVATYAQFARRAAAIAGGLRTVYGVRPGDRVALFMHNRTEYLELLYGLWWAGAVTVPVNAKLHEAEAAWIVDHSEARLFIGDGAVFTAAAERVQKDAVACLAVDTEDYAALLGAPPLESPVELDANDLVWLFYTSGTTGRPKGAMLSCGNIQAMTLSYFVDVDAVSQDDVKVYAAPISHGAGLYNFMYVMRGAAHVVPETGGFDPEEIFHLAAKFDRLCMFAAPTMVRRLVSYAQEYELDGAGFKTIVYGGGPMYIADIKHALDRLGSRFVQIYGQGECPMTITALSRDHISNRSHPRWEARLGSVGVAHSSVAVRIASSDGTILAPGNVGEIEVFGTPVMKGYWRNAEATAESIRNGWLRTGDLGEMDADGFLTLRDRSKDVIISGGTNIYPREVEEALLSHPDVAQACVVGLPDAEWGEIVTAYIVAEKDAALSDAILDAHCLSMIARFKRPKRYHFVDELPVNSYGKVLKRVLIENS